MRLRIVAIAVALGATAAHAQNCQTIGSQTLCDSGLFGKNSGNVEYWRRNSNGSGAYSSDGTTYQQLGNSRSYSNGITSQTYGNSTFYSDGRYCQKFGDQTTCN